MSGDLVAADAVDTSLIVHPGTGEAVPADQADQVARILDELREHGKKVQEQRRNAELALADYARTVGAKTFELAGFKVAIRDQDTITWDIDTLERLLELGLPEDRWNQLVEQTISLKVNTRVAKQLAAANPTYADVIEKAQERADGRLYVSVVPR